MILAFGDSISHGYGVDDELSYPRLIEKKTGLNIINAGVTGEISSEGLTRLPSLLEDKPDLVIICHGSRDIYNRLSMVELKSNMLAMVKLIQESGSKILLIGVPNFRILSNDIHPLYNEVAEECNILHDENILRNILTSNFTRNDYIHPNIEGYEILADAIIETLQIKKKES